VRTVSVSGSGLAYLVPDIAYIYVGVHTEKPSASEAMTENNAQTQKMIQALTDFGIDAKDIRTTNFSIWPMDKYDPASGLPTGEKTYSVDNTVYVTMRELDKLGSLLDTVVAAGANTVNSIQFDVADKTEAIKNARAEAVKDAEAQAQSWLQLVESSGDQPLLHEPALSVYEGRGGGGADVAAGSAHQPGQLTFTVSVNVTYAIK
jgi:uncharacterized protein YggE